MGESSHNWPVPIATELLTVDLNRFVDQPERRRVGSNVDSAIERAASLLRDGGLVAFPTETVYGLGAVASQAGAVRSVFVAKGRPATDPLIVHGTSLDQLEPAVGGWSDTALALAERFWPGPLTMVLPRGGAVADEVGAGGPTVGVRIPGHPVALEMLRVTGEPVAAPSANRFGRISPTTAQHVIEELGGAIDAVLDGGPTTLGIESTVVDLCGEIPRVLRPGGVTVEDLREVLDRVEYTDKASVAESSAAIAPGQFLRHYAPTTPLVLVEGPVQWCHQLVESLGSQGVNSSVVELADDDDAAARGLYGTLRLMDGKGLDLMLVAAREPTGLGRAVNDRLFRASHGRLVADVSPATVTRLVSFVC